MCKWLITIRACGILIFPFFSAHLTLRPYELLLSLFVRRPFVNISHFNLLLRNHWDNCYQTLVEWSLGGPLPKLCPVIPTSNQDGPQAKNKKKWRKLKKNLLLWNYLANLNQTLLKWSLDGPLPKCVRHFRPPTKMAATAELNLT
jgi:hypothetical protein